MTNPSDDQRAEAIAREAWERCTGPSYAKFDQCGPHFVSILVTAAKLALSGWTPTDPDLLEARKIVRSIKTGVWSNESLRQLDEGVHDHSDPVQIALAALRSRPRSGT